MTGTLFRWLVELFQGKVESLAKSYFAPCAGSSHHLGKHINEKLRHGSYVSPLHHWMESGADVAETHVHSLLPAKARRGTGVRLIIRRVKPSACTQLALIATYSYHAFVTDREGDTLYLGS